MSPLWGPWLLSCIPETTFSQVFWSFVKRTWGESQRLWAWTLWKWRCGHRYFFTSLLPLANLSNGEDQTFALTFSLVFVHFRNELVPGVGLSFTTSRKVLNLEPNMCTWVVNSLLGRLLIWLMRCCRLMQKLFQVEVRLKEILLVLVLRKLKRSAWRGSLFRGRGRGYGGLAWNVCIFSLASLVSAWLLINGTSQILYLFPKFI